MIASLQALGGGWQENAVPQFQGASEK